MHHPTKDPRTASRVAGLDRRKLFELAGTGVAGVLVSTGAAAAPFAPPSPVDTGSVADGKVKFPPWRNAADTPSGPPPSPLPPDQRVGFAIVGLGRLAVEQILPAFGKSMKARPVALVSGSRGEDAGDRAAIRHRPGRLLQLRGVRRDPRQS